MIWVTFGQYGVRTLMKSGMFSHSPKADRFDKKSGKRRRENCPFCAIKRIKLSISRRSVTPTPFHMWLPRAILVH